VKRLRLLCAPLLLLLILPTWIAASGADAPVSAPASAPTSAPASAASRALSQLPEPLQLDTAAFRLPAALLERPYRRPLHAQGGRPPYRFELAGGSLPEGIALSPSGVLQGTAGRLGSQRFTVRLVDALGEQTQQHYQLHVVQARPQAPAPAGSAAGRPKPLTTLLPEDALALPPPRPQALAHAYRLMPAVLDVLLPAETVEDGSEPAPLPEAATSAAGAASAASAASGTGPALPPLPLSLGAEQAEQLKLLLKPLTALEYPTRATFETALDAQLCDYSRRLSRLAATKQGLIPPSDAQFAAACPPDWAALAKAKPLSGPPTWQQLPQAIMPAVLRQWLVEAARQSHELKLDPPIVWDGAGCGCVREDLAGQVYGFYPLWWAQEEPQRIDFSLLSRISVLGLPFGDEMAPEAHQRWTRAQTDFIRTAHRHGTALDLVIYRNDWRFLQTEPLAAREALVNQQLQQLPEQARRLIDAPLPDWLSRAKAWLPGFAQTEHLGDGITLFFDAPPSASEHKRWRQDFDDFHHRFALAMIAQLRAQPQRQYTLNLVVGDRQLTEPGAFSIASLFELLKAAEAPHLVQGRIEESTAVYSSATNVTVRFVVLLSEPSTLSKKRLRSSIETEPALQGIDRRIFMRKLIPVLSIGMPEAESQQFADDLVYFEDNFGGVGFWPLPMAGQTVSPGMSAALRTAFSGAAADGWSRPLCDWACENRWPLRALFDLLLLTGLVCVALLLWDCAWRARWGRYLPLGGIPVVLVGALLLNCDPQLRALRDGTGLMWAVIAILFVAALWAVLKPKVEKP
jgi:Putative Ig domain